MQSPKWVIFARGRGDFRHSPLFFASLTEIADLRSEMRSELADVRTEIASLRGETTAAVAGLRAEMKADFVGVHKEITAQTRWILAGLAAAVTFYPIVTRLIARLIP